MSDSEGTMSVGLLGARVSQPRFVLQGFCAGIRLWGRAAYARILSLMYLLLRRVRGMCENNISCSALVSGTVLSLIVWRVPEVVPIAHLDTPAYVTQHSAPCRNVCSRSEKCTCANSVAAYPRWVLCFRAGVGHALQLYVLPRPVQVETIHRWL